MYIPLSLVFSPFVFLQISAKITLTLQNVTKQIIKTNEPVIPWLSLSSSTVLGLQMCYSFI